MGVCAVNSWCSIILLCNFPLLYSFSYDAWLEEAKKLVPENAEDVSTISDDSKRRFTDITRGTGKYKGWTEEGIELYNKIEAKLDQQREDPTLHEFERKVKDYFLTGGKKRKNTRGEVVRLQASNNFARKRRAKERSGVETLTGVGQQEAV
jgi:hypothetical protein